ncbi:MAG TPA: ADOP family duplicated permease [Gemmatimonadaceae bacterium]|nr:ADOP family duplicated permease [Gemmatimonadaceae bacterium]
MRVIARLRNLRWNLLHRSQVEQALDQELDAYVELLAGEYERSGMSAADARRRALVETGGLEQVKEQARDAWVGAGIANAARELRDALRSLRRSPGFLAIAIATLGLGIGGATAVFTIIDASLPRSLPSVREPDRLVTLEPTQGDTLLYDFGYPEFVDFRDQTTALSGLAAHDGTSMSLRDTAGSGRVQVGYVSGEFFSVLGTRPALGRLLGPSDAVPGTVSPVAVISYDLWQRRYGGSPSVVGTTVRVNGYPLTIIGVAERGFIGAMALFPRELWFPLTMSAAVAHFGDPIHSRGEGWFRLVGRLRHGKTIGDARRDLALIAARLARTYPEDRNHFVRVSGGATGMLQDERADLARLPRLLAVAVGLLLLIACANVANLFLVRAAARRRELATRIALGASRASLVRRLVFEGVIVASGAAIAGIALALLLVHSATIVSTVVGMSDLDTRLDWRVLTVSLAVTALTALLVSVAPALEIRGMAAGAVLKDGGGAVRRRSRGQRGLVVMQVAASLMLVASAALVFNAARRILTIDPGFDPRGVTSARLDPHEVGLDSARYPAFYDALLARVLARPEVAAAAYTDVGAPPAEWTTRVSVFVPGQEPPPGALEGHEFELGLRTYVDEISPGLLGTMRIPILLGRDFARTDDARAPLVVIVSRRLAHTFWPNENPIGKYLSWPTTKGAPRPPMRVVGVASDTRQASLTAPPPPLMYVPIAQHDRSSNLVLVLRARGARVLSDSVLHDIATALLPGVAVRGYERLTDHIAGQAGPQHRASAWIGVFGAIALLLAAIGLYGVVAQDVMQRTRELAIRSALGASPRVMLAFVVRDGLALALVGVALGSAATLGTMRVLQHQFAMVDALDPEAMLAATCVLALAMLAACYLPARRAARLNPVDALRSDT